MKVLAILLLISESLKIKLTPSRVESMLLRSPTLTSSEYEYRLSKNSFKRNTVNWLFSPEINYSMNRVNQDDNFYSEGTALYISIFSPSRLSLLNESYFSMKQSASSYRLSKSNAFIDVLGYIFDYEYTRQRLAYDSLNLEYATRMMELVKEKLSEGMVDSVSLLKAKDNLENIRLILLEDSSDLSILSLEICDMLGIKGDFVIVLDSFVPPLDDSISPLYSEKVIISRRIEKSALISTYLSFLSILPEIGLKYSWEYSGNRFEHKLDNFDYERTFRIYLTLNPIDFLFNYNRALLQYRKANWDLKNTLLEEKRRFTEISRKLLLSRSKLKLLKSRVYLKERTFTLTLEKYAQGELPLQDLLKEQADYMSIVSDYLKAKLDLLKLRYMIWYNFGGRR